MVQYYRDMWPRMSHVLDPLTEASRVPKGIKIFWNDALESSFKELKCMVSSEILLSYPDWTMPSTVNTDASGKLLGAVISQNNKSIALFSIKLSKPQRNYTTTKKELLAIVECLKQFCGILFGYEINVFSYHEKLVYAATLSESKRVMRWQLIIKEFGPNIQHISGVENIVAGVPSRFPSMYINN